MSIYFNKKTNRFIIRKFFQGRSHHVGSSETREEAEVIQKNFERDFLGTKNDEEKPNPKKWHEPDFWNKKSKESRDKILSKYA